MGIFDIFTGDSGKEAAAANSALYASNKKEGLGYLDTALTKSEGALGSAKTTLADLGSKYGAGSSLYLDALGANGAEGSARASEAFTTNPSYEFNLNAGLDAQTRAAAAAGSLNGGNTQVDAMKYAQGYAGNEYQNWLNNLQATINPEVTATTGQAGVDTSLAGLYQSDANSRIGVGNTATTGQTNANTQSANAEMAGSGNLWNFGLNLAKLGTGQAGAKFG